MKTTKSAVLILLFIFCSMQLFAGETVYKIRSAEFFSEGRTLPYFLKLAAEIEVGRQFNSSEELKSYIEDRKQFLSNQRVLATVMINAETGTPEGDIIPVDLKILTTDTWNMIALPYFRYDDNTGLLLSVRARDYNFLGSMKPLRINLNWEMDKSSNISWGADADFKYPFEAWGHDWLWDVKTVLDISGTGADFSFDTGLALYMPTKVGKLVLDAGQVINIAGKNTEYALNGDRVYFTENIGASLIIPILSTSLAGDLSWTPSLTLRERWDFDGLQSEELIGPDLILGQNLGIGRVDWEGNFRSGFKLSAGNSNTWNFWSGSWDRNLSASAAAYTNREWVGISSKFSYIINIDSTDTSAGDPIRGVLNDRIDADTAMFVNFDLPVRVIRFMPSQWFDKSWMRLFNFEQHWSPFLDLAWSLQNGVAHTSDDVWYAGGLEVITYPLMMRSFYLRISMGWDLKEVMDRKSLSGVAADGYSIRELFLGFGHHY